MLDLQHKHIRIKDRLTQVKSLYDSGNTALHASIAQVESRVEDAVAESLGIVTGEMSDVRIISATQCLGLQFPIPDLEAVLARFAQGINGLGLGTFLDDILDGVDTLTAMFPVHTALEKLDLLSTALAQKIAGLANLRGIFDAFAGLQDQMRFALASVSSLVGCGDAIAGTDLSGHLQSLSGVMAETNPKFKQGLDAVDEAKAYFENPGDILADAKNRITAKLDLDGQMAALEQRFNSGLAGFI